MFQSVSVVVSSKLRLPWWNGRE